ncbi:NAD-dependent epimerase/dehydratase family protein [Mangrovibacterium diazotrophicum]|uniref:Nucleoside-diphosphate-sugar epimerase n=1 Tax=Mangrovibacterium diazotrophicum TaxID=1261403 RepID=A0A419W9G1_9BACT|nr:NAD-dependent epimerase/dehydratase family protein [Mangrovibacterium diazotrophicum]RKD92103.1 nucleoside-diphosphate-sugar epimerase [Mangrovibacterium diazotrophicum]
MIFVTGGTGLVGSHLLFNLLRSGKQVRALKRSSSNLKLALMTFSYYSDQAEELFQKIDWVEGDILDYHSMEELLAGVTDVYHCAAMVSFHPNDHDSMLNNNVKGTANLIDAAIFNKVKRFCHVSSIAALGHTQDGTEIDEETYWIPSKQKSAYSLSKFFSEMEVWRGIEEGMDAVIVNPSIILGPGNWDIGSPKLFQSIWKGLGYYTKGENGFVDVRDVAEVMTQLMQPETFSQHKNQRFILNAGNMGYQEFFNKIADALQRPRPKTFASDMILQVAWRAARMASFFSGKRPVITKEAVSGSNRINHYNGSKIQRSIAFEYRGLDHTIQDIARLFLKDVELLTPPIKKKKRSTSQS